MKIEKKHWEKAYELGRKVYDDVLDNKVAVAELVDYGMNPNSAKNLFRNLQHMLRGENYRRAMSNANTDDFLTWIRRDDGEAGHVRAVASLKQHLEYYFGLKGDKLASHRAILAKHEALLPALPDFFDSPEEVPSSATHLEGKVRQVLVNSYERNPKARTKCISHYGAICSVCAFDFGMAYGKIGEGFIHVHHLKEISSIAEEYEVDPIEDLRPVCPNCHAMLHTQRPALTIEMLKSFFTKPNELVTRV